MKVIIASILFLMSSIIHCYSDELIDLRKLNLSDEDELIYASKRCASVSLVMLLRVRDKNDQDLNRNLTDKYRFFSKMAGVLSIEGKTENLTEYINQSTDDIKSISYIYGKIVDDNYLLTGKTIPDIVNIDSIFCNTLYINAK